MTSRGSEKMTGTTIGIDISKHHLDVHRLPGGERDRFDNTSAGHKALLRWIGPIPTRVVYEPTGPYHRKLEMRLAAAGMSIVKVNPRQARRFAQAAWTCRVFVPLRLLVWATWRSKAKGLLPPNAECRRRGL